MQMEESFGQSSRKFELLSCFCFFFPGHPQYVFHHTPNPMEVLGKLDLPGDPKPTCHVGIR